MGKSSSQTIGYKYLLGMHVVLAEAVDKVLAIRFSDRVAWEGVSEGGQIEVNEPELFGGKKREGGVSGTIDVLMGGPTQTTNDYLVSRLGAVVPAFRRVASLVFRQFYFGNNPYLKPLAVKVTGIHSHGEDWYSEKAEIGHGYGGSIEDAKFYVAIDASNSMPTRLNDLTANMTYFLNQFRDAGLAIDIKMVAFENAIRDEIAMVAETDADYDALIAWLEGLDTGGSQEYDIGFGPATDYFTGGLIERVQNFDLGLTNPIGESNVSAERRIMILLTDGLEPENLPEAQAIVGAIDDLEFYAFNVQSVVTVGHTTFDNTPADAVPLVTDDDPTTIFNSIFPGFLTWVDMNPAHILRDVLGRKLGHDRFGTTWTAVADQLYAEGFGLSFHWQTPSATEDFVRLVESHIDAQHYEDPNTGRIEIALIRDDYDVEDLPVFGTGGDYPVVEWLDVAWPQPEDLPNQITVKWTKRDGTQGAVTYANIAAVQATGRVVPDSVDYVGITRHDLAARVCLRELATRTTSLLGGAFYVTHLDPALHEGSPILVNETRLGIVNTVCRIVEIEEPNGTDNRVLVKFVQDKFALGSVALVSDPGEVTTTRRAQAATVRFVEEAPYYAMVLDQGQADVDAQLTAEPDQGLLVATAENPDGGHQDFVMALSTDGGTTWVNDATGDFCPATTLAAPLSAAGDAAAASFIHNGSLSYVRVGSLARIGAEYVRVDAMTVVDGLVQATLGRGCLDTVPAFHAVGATVLFWQDFLTTDETAYLATEVLDVKLRTRTASDMLRLTAAPTDTLTFASRAIRPYPPGRVKLEGSYAPTGLITEPATLTWAHRDRTLQTTPTPEDHDDTSIGPETDVTYVVEARSLGARLDVFDDADVFSVQDVFAEDLPGTLEREIAVGSVTTYEFSNGAIDDVFAAADVFAEADVFGGEIVDAALIALGVRSLRDGYSSWQVPYVLGNFGTAPAGFLWQDFVDMFAASEKGEVWPVHEDYFFTDTGCTTPVGAVGDEVKGWLGAKYNIAFTQGTAGRIPKYARMPPGGWKTIFVETEDLTATDWYKTNTTITAGQADPDSGSNAFLVTGTTNGGLAKVSQDVYRNANDHTFWLIAKAGNVNRIAMSLEKDNGTYADNIFDLSSGTWILASGSCTRSQTDLGSGWWRISLHYSELRATAEHWFGPINSAGTGVFDTTNNNTVYVYHPQLEEAAAATTFEARGSLYEGPATGDSVAALYFDGVNDSMSCPAIDLTGTNEVTLFVGFHKRTKAVNYGAIIESSADPTTNNGAFALMEAGVSGADQNLLLGARGNASLERYMDQAMPPQSHLLLSCIYDLSASGSAVFAPRAQYHAATYTATTHGGGSGPGSGNFGNHQFYLGARGGGASGGANGYFVGALVVLGRIATGAEITDGEAVLAATS